MLKESWKSPRKDPSKILQESQKSPWKDPKRILRKNPERILEKNPERVLEKILKESWKKSGKGANLFGHLATTRLPSARHADLIDQVAHFGLSQADAAGTGGAGRRIRQWLDELADDAPRAETKIVPCDGCQRLALQVAHHIRKLPEAPSGRRVIRHLIQPPQQK